MNTKWYAILLILLYNHLPVLLVSKGFLRLISKNVHDTVAVRIS